MTKIGYGRNLFRSLCLLFVAVTMAGSAYGQGRPPSGNANGNGGGNCTTCVTTLGGSLGRLPVFKGATTIGDSVIAQTPTGIAVAGDVNATSVNASVDITAAGNIGAAGSVTGNNVNARNTVQAVNVYATGNIQANGYISAPNFLDSGDLSVGGNQTIAGTLQTGSSLTVGGDITGSGSLLINGVNVPPTSLSNTSPSHVLNMWATTVDPSTSAITSNHFRWQVAPADAATGNLSILNLAYDDGLSAAVPVAQFYSNGFISASGAGGGVFGQDTTNTAGYGGIGVAGFAASDSSAGVLGRVTATTIPVGAVGSVGVLGQSLATSGWSVGVRGDVRSSAGAAGIFDSRAAGADILLGRIPAVGGGWANMFRVDRSGRGYFANGTQTGGADFAESFEVVGNKEAYEPGDVLAIDPNGVRRMTLSQEAYSTRVAGIYSTKPGVLASPHEIDSPKLASEVPLAVVGIVPCKVTAKNGAIQTGDLLVSSDIPGFAMKGTDRSRMLGAVVGKALQPLAAGSGIIQVLVTLQ